MKIDIRLRNGNSMENIPIAERGTSTVDFAYEIVRLLVASVVE